MTPSTVTIIGNLTRDPELRFTQSGRPVSSFSVAVNKRKRNEAGEWEDAGADFFNVTAWGSLGENLANSLEKGTRVIVTGRLVQRQWETDQGDKRTAVEIVAEAAGPDMTWATAKVDKVTRRHPDQPPHPAEYDPGEEPF